MRLYSKINANLRMKEKCMGEILERLGLNEREVREIFRKRGLDYDAERLEIEIEKLQSLLGFSDLAIYMMITIRPDLLANKTSVDGIFDIQHNFQVPRSELRAMMSSAGINRFEPEREYLARIQREVGLSAEEMKSLILHSRITQRRPTSEDIRRDIEILEALGFNRAELHKSASVLVLAPIHLIDVLKLGMIYYGKEDIHGFSYYNRHRQDRNRVYARMMAERNGEIKEGLAYLPDSEFLQLSNGVTDAGLMAKYKLNPESRVDLDNELSERFPIQSAILEEFEGQEIEKLLDQRRVDLTQVSADVENANREVLKNRACLSDEQANRLMERIPELKTVNTNLLIHNINSIAYLVGKANVKKVVMAKQRHLIENDNLFYNCFRDMRVIGGITRAQYGMAILGMVGLSANGERESESVEQNN